jgi:peptide deformylase
MQKMLEEEGEEWCFNEGALSIPDVREDVYRNNELQLSVEEDFCENRVFDGLIARVIQHEYDHIEGILQIKFLIEKPIDTKVKKILSKVKHSRLSNEILLKKR